MQLHAPAHGGASTFVAVKPPLAPEEQARADLYGLLARLLLAPPDAPLLDQLAASTALAPGAPDAAITTLGPVQPLEQAWDSLSLTARLLPASAVLDEYNDLFISTAAPRISPHASIYLAGFLHEKPLAQLRLDLARLGLGRRAGASETEDHLGALCETMRQLILRRVAVERQQAFFAAYLASWSGTCLAQLRAIDGARFYARVAGLASALFAVEAEAFELVLDDAPDSHHPH